MKKRLLSILTVLALCLSLLPVTALPAFAEGESYHVAGEAALCGSLWDPGDDNNLMTLNADTGLYEKTYTDVRPGEYQIKVVETCADGTTNWYGDAQDGNFVIYVSAACDVTVTFDAGTHAIGVLGDSAQEKTWMDIDAIRVVGNGNGAWLNGVSWDPAADANKMTEVSPNVYEITYAQVPAGSGYQFKFAANGSWADNWGGGSAAGEAVFDSDDSISLVLTETTDVTLRLDLTGFVYATKLGATYEIVLGSEDDTEKIAADYLDAEGNLQTCAKASVLTADVTAWKSGWYVAQGEVTIPEAVTLNGDVHLILADDCTLTAESGIAGSGSLTVYAQSTGDQMGSLTATGIAVTEEDSVTAGISAGAITINGGTINANGGTGEGSDITSAGPYSTPGDITINGGNVTATGGTVTGECGKSTGIATEEADIIVNGGTVIATGASRATWSIGIYPYWGAFRMNGGKVTATGKDAEYDGSRTSAWSIGVFSDDFTVSGGELTATAGTATGYMPESYGIFCAFAQIDGGTVIAEADAVDGGQSYGISNYGTFTVTDGQVIAMSGAAAYSFGIQSIGGDQRFSVSGDAAVEATSGEGTNLSAGVYVYSWEGSATVSISDHASLLAIGKHSDKNSYGIYAESSYTDETPTLPSVQVIGGDLNVVCFGGGETSYGVYAATYLNSETQQETGGLYISSGHVRVHNTDEGGQDHSALNVQPDLSGYGVYTWRTGMEDSFTPSTAPYTYSPTHSFVEFGGAASYGVSVNGVDIDEVNYTDVLSDGVNDGKVSYDPATSTLIVTGALKDAEGNSILLEIAGNDTTDVVLSDESSTISAGLTVFAAKDVTLTANSGDPAIEGEVDITCSGDVTLANNGTGIVVTDPLTVNGAQDVTVTANSSSPAITSTAIISCSGDVEIVNLGGGKALAATLQFRSTGNHGYTVKTGADPETLSVFAEKAANETFGPEAIQASMVKISLSHNMTKTEAKEPTCTEDGNSAYWTCSVCGKYFSDEKGETEVEKDSWVIQTEGHSLTDVDEVPATCAAEGIKAHQHCSVCGKDFIDGAEQTARELAIAKLSHSYDSNGFCTGCDGYRPADLSEEGVYLIGNAGQLYWFAALVNGTLDGFSQNIAANAVLTANITVNENVLNADGTLAAETGSFRTWTPLGNAKYDSLGGSATNSADAYAGTFDGRNYTISGLYLNDAEKNDCALFGMTAQSASISNLTIRDSFFGGYNRTAGVCAINMGAIDNCTSFGTVSGYYWYAGGVCGWNTNGGTITNCTNFGTVTAKDFGVGGVCSSNYSGSSIEHCRNEGTVTGARHFGGVCGENRGSITDCSNTANITYFPTGSADLRIAGVCGQNYGSIAFCSNEGAVTGKDNTGGICGDNMYGTITNCTNSGTIKGESRTGGVCGGLAGKGAAITNCINTGNVTGKYENIGGVCGTATSSVSNLFTNCFNSGSVSGSGRYIGGVCGNIYSGVMANCANIGPVTATGNATSVGIICGQTGDNCTAVTNCYYDSNLTGEAVGASSNTDTSITVSGKTAAQFAGGEVAWLLNESKAEAASVWRQDLDNGDTPGAYPLPVGTEADSTGIVYRIEITKCDGTATGEVVYSNTNDARTLPHRLTKTEAKEPTCTEDGNSAYWTCSVCGRYFSDEEGKNEIEEDSWVIPAGHKLNKTEAKEPSCTEAGNSEYWTCSVCGRYFSDEEGKNEIEKDSWIIDATGHTLTKTEAKDPTCTEAGNSEYWTCSVCGKYFSDEKGTTEIEKDSWIIDATGHSLTKTEANAPTCTEAGNSEYWTCSVCGKYFSDENGKTELAKDSWVIDATGHSLTKTEANAPTCTEAGNSEYWTCSVCGKYFSDEAGTAEIAKDSWVISATGHTLTKTAAKNPTCTEAGNSEYWTCSVCGKYFSDEEGKTEIEEDSWVIPTGHKLNKTEAKEPSCTEAGNSEYRTCSACGKYFSDEAGTTEIAKDSWKIAATGHTPGEWEHSSTEHWNCCTVCAAECERAVHTFSGRTCTVCGYTKVIPFVDVPDDAYCFDAVLWAVENGITNGTSDTTFSPEESCTRAQAVTFLWRAAGCPSPKSGEMPFKDVVKGSYYETAVLWAVENGITKGTSATTFSPDVDCTRAQIVTFLWRSKGMPDAGTTNPFTDVTSGKYYYSAVLWAVENGITKGTSATTFSPNEDCTRAQIVTFLYRCLSK